MKLHSMAALAAASALAAGAAGAASASVLYDNGPINGGIEAWPLTFGDAVSDSFTLTSAATVTGVDFGVWTFHSDTLSSVDWGITSTPADYVDDGTAAVTTGATHRDTSDTFYDISADSFSIGPVILAAGTYYLVLQNASASDGDPAFWDENGGASTATANVAGTIPSESFQILGEAVPEPSSWALMIAGAFGAGAVLRRRRTAAPVAAIGPLNRFQMEEMIDPRDTRRLICEWAENA